MSSVVWENLEEWVRGRTQGYLQDLLVEEVTVFLGREKSERRAEIDGPRGYRNGYWKVRKLALSCGTVALARPRVRGVEERFESRLLPLFVYPQINNLQLPQSALISQLKFPRPLRFQPRYRTPREVPPPRAQSPQGEFKVALLVVVAGLSDGRKVFLVLAITSGYRESVGRRCCGI